MSKISDERREVAARLRSGIVARNIPEAYVAIVQSIGVRPCLLLHDGESGDRFDRSAYELALSRLADLIDPTCSVVRKQAYTGGPQMYKTLWCCSECGFPLAESKYKGHRPFVEEIFCPHCGSRVVSHDDN